MPGLTIEIDPTSEGGTPLLLTDSTTGRYVTEADWPIPDPEPSWTSNVDTEGERLVSSRYKNRELSLTLRLLASTPQNLTAQLKLMQQKAGKLAREGGTLKVTYPDGNVVIFDVLTADVKVPVDKALVNTTKATVELRLTAKPFARGIEHGFHHSSRANLCPNPKLSVDTSCWLNSGFTSITRVASPGSWQWPWSARLIGSATSQASFVILPMEAGKTYTFSATVILDAKTGAATLGSYIADAGFVNVGYAATVSTVGNTVRISGTVTSGSGNPGAIAFYQNGAGSIDARISGVLIEEGSTVNEYVDGDSPGWVWSGTAGLSTSRLPGFVRSTTATRTNLVTNPRLFVNTTGWTSNGLISITRTASPAGFPPSGDFSLRCQGNTAGKNAYVIVAGVAGVTYTVSAWVYVTAGADIRLMIYDPSLALAAQSGALPVGQWSRVALTFTANGTGNFIPAFQAQNAGTSDYYVTNVLMEAGPWVGSYADGDSAGWAWTGTAHQSTSNAAGVAAVPTHTETNLPALTLSGLGAPGDVPALGRIVLTDAQGVDQGYAVWGLRSRYDSGAASAAHFIEAETLTLQGGSSLAVGTGSSGSGSNVVRNTDLSPSFVSILSGQLASGGAYLSHVGSYRVMARVYCPTGNAGQVDIALEWAEGDFRRVARNATVTYEDAWRGSWRLVDLGQVKLNRALKGTQRWEPRVLARSTVVGDELDVDWLLFVPGDEGSGEASATYALPAPSAYTARDEFNQGADATFTGNTLPVGGTWTGYGDADDFAVDGNGLLTRSTLTDGDGGSGASLAGRYLYPSSATSMTATAVQATFSKTGGNISDQLALLARRSSNTSFAYLRMTIEPDSILFSPRICVSGVFTALDFSRVYLNTTQPFITRFVVLANGRWSAYLGTDQNTLKLFMLGQHNALATGGALATGAPGIFDYAASNTAGTRTVYDFQAWVPNPDAVAFANRSVEIRNDGVIREDAAGTIWTPVSRYEGDYLQIPAAGLEGRTFRAIAKASRHVPGTGPDSAIDDLSARLFATPRYLQVGY